MADTSRNPNDNANLDKLNAKLSDIEATLERQLQANLRATEEVQATARQTEQTVTAARAESKARTAQVGRGGAPSDVSPAQIEKAANQAERLAAARTTSANAAQREAQAQGRINQELLLAAQRVKESQGLGTLQKFGLAPPQPARAADPLLGQAMQVKAAVEAAAAAEQRALSDASRDAIANARANRQAPTGVSLPAVLTDQQQYAQRAQSVGLTETASPSDVAQREKNISYTQRAKAGEIDFTKEIRAEAQAWSLAANTMTRHGYMTSEFIDAAARGQVTFRQLGENVGGTIAKFSGWTAAATAVYGVVGAMHALGQGAIQAESGVGLVSRIITNLDTGKLRESFRNLSAEFNLPIDQVTQAVYGAAKVYNDQGQAVEAARQILFAMKVGELDAASATRYLTSIVAGFKLEAGQLPAVFDAINQAQNKFGGNTGQMVAGVAKAAGAFKLAGGSYKELIALVETGSKLTGASGENVGTAISRSASTVLTKQGAARLAAAGLTPGQDYPKLLAQAFSEAQGASPERVQEIARSLIPAGGQFARIFVPILEDRQLYNKVLKEITDHSQGSASRELAKALSQPDEQLKSLTNSAQRLGAALGQAGALAAPFILLVEPLRLALDLAGKLTGTLDLIPAPIRDAATALVEVIGLLKVARRFDLGAHLPLGTTGSIYNNARTSSGLFGLSRSPDARLNSQITKDISETTQNLGDKLAAQRSQNIGLGFQATAAKNAALAAQGTDEENALGARGRATQERLLEGQRRALAVETEIASLAEANNTYLLARKEGLSAEAAANRAGILTTTGTLNRGAASAERLYPVDIATASGVGAATAAASRTESAVAAAESSAATRAVVAETAGVAAATLAEKFASLRDRLSSEQGGVLSPDVQSKVAVEGGAKAAESLRGNLLKLGGGLLLAVASVKGFVDANDAAASRVAGLRSAAGGPEAIQKRIDAENSQNFLTQGGGLSGIGRRAGIVGGDILGLHPGKLFEDIGSGLGFHTGEYKAATAAAQQQAFVNAILSEQKHGEDLTDPQIAQRLAAARAASSTPAGDIAALQTAIKQTDSGYSRGVDGSKKALETASAIKLQYQQLIAQIKAAHGNIDQALKLLTDLPQVQTFINDLDAKYGLQANTRHLYPSSNIGIIAAARAAADDPSKNADALKAISQADDQVTKDVQARVDAATKYGNPQTNRSARDQAVRDLRKGLIGKIPEQISNAQSDLQQLYELQDTQAIQEPNKAPDKGLEVRVASTKRRIRAFEDLLTLNNRKLDSLQRDFQRQDFEEAGAVYDANTQLLVTQAGNDPAAVARIQLSRQNARLGAIAKEYTTNSVEYVNALNAAAQDRQATVSAALDQFNAGVDVATAKADIGATDAQKQARSKSDALAKYNYARDHLPAGDTRVQSALKDYYDALGQSIDQAKQTAQDLLSARRELALSTLDPSNAVAAAAVNLRYDRQLVTAATTQADKIRAQASVNKDIQTQRDARLEAKASTIDFQTSMEKIDNDTAAAEYSALARRVKNNKDLKRQYELKAKELRDAVNGTEQIGVDNIKLPTIYDVRRMARQGTQTGPRMEQSNTFHTTITDPAAADRFWEGAARTLGSGTASAMRSAGLS